MGGNGHPHPDSADNIDSDPEFEDDTDPNGLDGEFKTGDDGRRITSGSDCKNNGDNDFVTEDYDIKGDDRIMQNIVDIGAYEYKP